MGVMKRAVKWTSTDIDTSTDVDRRRAGKVQSGQRPPIEKGRLKKAGRQQAALFITPLVVHSSIGCTQV